MVEAVGKDEAIKLLEKKIKDLGKPKFFEEIYIY